MKKFQNAALALVVGGAAIALTAQPSIAAPPSAGPTLAPQNTATSARAEAKSVDVQFTDTQIEIMARTSGRSVEVQRAHLAHKNVQNNLYADLAKSHSYDGAYFTEQGELVVQAAAGSPAAKAARAKGLQVRTPQHGEARLSDLVAEVAKAGGAKVATVTPDIVADKVVVTATDPAAARASLSRFGDAVEVRQGERMVTHLSISGGDKITMSAYGGGYCSAGFPAKTSGGRKVMVWAGHCVEGASAFYKSGARIGTAAASGFVSYDGRPDRDLGAIYVDSDDVMTTRVNTYNDPEGISQASSGAWKAPVGTDMCKSGATSGVTCGVVRGYNASVTYTDDQGRTVAQVSGLGTSTVCTAPGDSGGAYVSGGYAVGMTSGGPAVQTCRFNGGYEYGKSSYFQPVTDALSYYGLTYGQ
ncbi:S1 family peptidase [Mariniluteicoccus flavus]